MRQTTLAALWLTLALSASAVAQQTVLDGNMLQNQCAFKKQIDAKQHVPEEDYGRAMFCIGYIRAALDSIVLEGIMKVTRAGKEGEWIQPCIPKSVTNEQAVKVVVKYLDDNPASLHLPATLLILKAMADAFPCTVK